MEFPAYFREEPGPQILTGLKLIKMRDMRDLQH
jgi:hypothetical protein